MVEDNRWRATVTGTHTENGDLVLETAGDDNESDLISVDGTLYRRSDLLTDEQRHVLKRQDQQNARGRHL